MQIKKALARLVGLENPNDSGARLEAAVAEHSRAKACSVDACKKTRAAAINSRATSIAILHESKKK